MRPTSTLTMGETELHDITTEFDQETRKKKIFILDDHPMVRKGIRQLLESQKGLEVCGEAASSDDALSAIDKIHPDLVTVDLSLKDSSGLDFIKIMKSRYPRILALVISMHDDPSIFERALKVGASGYVSKAENLDTILKAIDQILKGEHYLSELMKKKLMENEFSSHPAGEISLSSLSDRELEVFQILASGQTISEIAGHLHLSVKTVEGYCANIRKKLGLNSNQELVFEASRRLPGG